MIKCIHTNTITYFASTRLNIVKTLKLISYCIVTTQYCDTDTGIYVYRTPLKNIMHMHSTLAVRL